MSTLDQIMSTVDGLMNSPEWDRLWALCRSGPEHFVVLTMHMPIGVQVLGQGKTAVEACFNAIQEARNRELPHPQGEQSATKPRKGIK